MLSGHALASQIGEFLGRRVTRVEVVIEGAPGSATTEIKSLIEIAPGQEYSPVRIHDSLVRLHQSGLISGATVEGVADGATGVILRFIVRPQARIDNIVFEGDTIFPDSELRARINELDPGEPYSPGAVQRGVAELLAFYSSRGYLQAQVRPEVRLDEAGTRAVVVYTITPGEQATAGTFNVDVQGTQIDLSKLEQAIAPGKPFAQADVQTQMERIRLAYLEQDFLAARVSSSIRPNVERNTVDVTISVQSGPKAQIEVQGYEISNEKRREVFPFYQQGGLDDFTLEEGRRRLQDYLQQQGYFFAQVTRPPLPDLSLPVVQLLYTVNQGRRLRLTNIEIEGNDAIPTETLQADMKSKEASPIPIPFFGLGRGITSNEMLRQDSNLIIRRMRELGYRRAQVDVRQGVSLTGESLIVTFDVSQGPRTYVEEIGMRGNNVLTRDALRGEFIIEPGDPLVAAQVSQTSDRLAAAYTSLGYANVEVVSELVELGNVNGEDRARLIFNINEGNRVRISNIITRGNAITKVGRLERDFYRFKQGEWLRLEDLQETERQLYETNAFNSVQISSEPVGETANGVEQSNVVVNLFEAKRRDLLFGFGYQSNRSRLSVPGLDFLNGGRGLVQLTHTNLFGRLYTGSTQLRVSRNELFGQLSFLDPRPFGKEYPTLISFFARRLAEKNFRSDRYTASVQVQKRISEDTITYVSYNFERVSVYDLPPDFTPEELERNAQPIRIGRLALSYVSDKRDNRFDPSRGSQTLGNFSFATKGLGGNEQFVKGLVEHNRYYPAPRVRDTVYSISARVGLASPFGGAQTLPISERFFAGGARDLRGFGFEEAGPSIVVPQRNNDGEIIRDANGNPLMELSPLGGNAVIVLNNELRFPIWKIFGGQVFSDTGNVFRRVRDIKLGDMTQTLGFGFRIKTPIGPVRLDFGWLVANKPEGIRGSRIHFTIGQTF
jgi:outer membrane protein insertion porin family